MELSVTVLGSSSAIPLSGRNPTSQFITISNRHFLVDCGEGTQVQLRRNKIGFGRINHILISHLHGDHFYGLLPLLNTLHLLDRHKEIHIYGPSDLEGSIYHILKLSRATLRFPIRFYPLNMKERDLIYEDKAVKVHSFPVKHSLPCCGFLFEEKPRPRNFKKQVLEKYSIPVAEIRQIKQGSDWMDESGNIMPNAELTTDPLPPLSYAYCTDTAPISNLEELLQLEPDLLYHEATFTEEHAARAAKTKHSTALQAAQVAKSVEAKHLLIGHFSVRYEDLEVLVREAQSEFKDTHLALEGNTYSLKDPTKLKVSNTHKKTGSLRATGSKQE